VPGDTGQVVYVWFDALANYLSALGYGDPGSPDYGCWWAGADERIHVIGKGILRFHAVYWPAFLASAGEPGPTRIHVHPYLSIGGAKLSKSSGSGLDPVDLVARYGVDALRWWCACDVSAVADTDFSEERLVARANEDLAGGFANVVSRITALVHRHFGGALPDGPAAPLAALEHLADNVHDALADFDLRRGTRLLIEAVAALNRHLEDTAPWALAKKPGRGGELERLLRCHLTSAAEVARALSPVLPNLAGRLERQLGRPGRPLVRPEPTYRWLPAAGGDGYRAATPERDRSESNSA
jgi:methionyl-tRNA synthetase